jgi:ABC-type arginine transport system permease subunit
VKPKDTITNAQVDAASQRLFTFFAIAACLFLLFVTAVIIIALRLKKRSEAAVLEP